MKELREKIEYLLQNSDGDKAIIESIRNETSAEPFGTESRMLAYLLSIGKISFEDYLAMSNEYNERVQKNSPFLYLFEMAPRTFGQMWGNSILCSFFLNLQKQRNRIYHGFILLSMGSLIYGLMEFGLKLRLAEQTTQLKREVCQVGHIHMKMPKEKISNIIFNS